VDSILYLSLLLADQPRQIDSVIDYFGDPSSDCGVPASMGRTRPHDVNESLAHRLRGESLSRPAAS